MKSLFFASLTAIFVGNANADFIASFTKNQITVGQNAGVVNLPIKVTGSLKYHPGAIDIKCINGTAMDGIDYKSEDDGINFGEAGSQKIALEIKRIPRYSGRRYFIVTIKPIVSVSVGKIGTIKVFIEGADPPPDTDGAKPEIKTMVEKLPANRWRVVTVATDENGKKQRQTFTLDPNKIKRTKTFETP